MILVVVMVSGGGDGHGSGVDGGSGDGHGSGDDGGSGGGGGVGDGDHIKLWVGILITIDPKFRSFYGLSYCLSS